jgi:transcriptional regulator with XRE-family HTH domain
MDAAQEVLAVTRARSWLRTGRARALRERAGLSQADIGRAAGTDPAQISRWESGKAAPHRRYALRLAGLYDGLEEIIGGEDAPQARASGREGPAGDGEGERT